MAVKTGRIIRDIEAGRYTNEELDDLIGAALDAKKARQDGERRVTFQRAYTEAELVEREDNAHRQGFELGFNICSALSEAYQPLLHGIFHIHTIAATVINEDQLRQSMRGLDGELAEAFTCWVGKRREVGIVEDHESKETISAVNRFVSEHVNAVQALVAGEDKGDRLRMLTENFGSENVKKILDVRSNIDVGGRSRGMSPWRYELAEKWLAYEDKYRRREECEPMAGEVLQALRLQLTTADGKPRPDLNPREAKQAKSLGNVEWGREGDYGGKLKAAYRKETTNSRLKPF